LPISSSVQRAALRSLREKGLRTVDDVAALISWLRRPIIGTHVNCGAEDHVAPFRFLSDVLLGLVSDFIVWANRSGSKSYLAALLTWVRSLLTPGLETTILGGSFEQSERVYKAMDEFWNATDMRDELLEGEPTRHLTRWRNGSQVSVLTASERSTRGPHPQALIMDEIDVMGLDVYTSALSQPQTKRGVGSSLGRFSTNHRMGGVMDMALTQATASRQRVYKWCVWECLKSCRDYSCSTCKATPWCPGQQMKQADGYYELEDFLKKAADLSEETLMTEWLCRKVGRSDLIYGGYFSLEANSPLDLPGFNLDLPVLVSIDWGGSNPFSVGAWQRFIMGEDIVHVRIDEVYMPGTNKALLAECKLRPWWANIPRWPVPGGTADPSRSDLIGEWRDEGINLIAADNDVDRGIEAVRVGLRPLFGKPKIMAVRLCQAWLREVQAYSQRNGRPVKENDHAMDETRYYTLWQIGKPARRGRVYFSGMGPRVNAPAPAPAAPPAQPETLKTPPPTGEGGQDGSQQKDDKLKRQRRVFFTGSGR
jgi:hypothetical protein